MDRSQFFRHDCHSLSYLHVRYKGLVRKPPERQQPQMSNKFSNWPIRDQNALMNRKQRRAAAKDPNYFFNFGNRLMAQGKFEEAIAAYRRVINIKPDFAEAHSNLGIMLVVQGKLEEAIAAFRRAISI